VPWPLLRHDHGRTAVARGFTTLWLFNTRRQAHFLWSTERTALVLPNVRAEAPGAAGCLARGPDDDLPPVRGQGSRPWRVASRARG